MMGRPRSADRGIPALVLGTGITALGMVRCLGRQGIPAYLWDDEANLASRSRWAKSLPSRWGRGGGMENLSRELQNIELERAVLVPCSDAAVLAAAGLPEELHERFPVSLPGLAQLRRLVDKQGLARLLRDEGIPHPSTWTIEDEDALATMPEERFLEGFLKPRDSQAFFRHFATKAFFVEDRADAVERYRKVRDAGLDVVLQEYVPGPPSNHVFFEGVRDRNGEIAAPFARRRLRMYPPGFGNSSLMVSVSPDEVAGAVEHMKRLLAAVAYRGVFSAEFKQHARDGTYRLLEVNCRPWWYVEFAERSGAAIGTTAYYDALDLSHPDSSEPEVGIHCVYPEYDLAGFRYQSGGSRVSAWRWFRPWLRARQAVLVWDDPLPAVHAGARYLWERLFRRDRNQSKRPPTDRSYRQSLSGKPIRR